MAIIQDILVDTARREELIPSRTIINAAEVALSEFDVISQTPETNTYRGTVRRRPFHFVQYRIHSRSQHPDRRDAQVKVGRQRCQAPPSNAN